MFDGGLVGEVRDLVERGLRDGCDRRTRAGLRPGAPRRSRRGERRRHRPAREQTFAGTRRYDATTAVVVSA